MVNKKLSMKNIQFNESNLSVLKYFTLLQNGSYELEDFKNLQKELKDAGFASNEAEAFKNLHKLQEVTIMEHISRVIFNLTMMNS
jgi:hypothetical protein